MRTGMGSVAAAAAFAVGLSGCATFQGVAEFETYRRAYEAAYAVGSQILDQLAVAERAAFLIENPETLPLQGFNPANAAYYATRVDPPGTAAFQRALDVVKAYNDLLYGLTSGQTAELLVAKLSELGSRAVAAGTEIDGAFAALGGGIRASALLSGLDAALEPIKAVSSLALRYQARAAFRDYILEYHEPIRRMIAALRDGTAQIFPLLTLAAESSVFRGGQVTPALERIAGYRGLLSDWVLLLDASSAALDRAIVALSAPPTLIDAVGGMTAAAIEVEVVARSAREHIAELAVN